MSFISWVKENQGKHGLLVPKKDSVKQIFFPTRLRMYLGLMKYLPLPLGWLRSLPKLDTGFTISAPESGCPICTIPYYNNFNEHLSGTNQIETPAWLPCGHIMGLRCVAQLVKRSNTTTCVVCPFCRASHNHLSVSAEGTEYKLEKCMWIMLETFVRLHGGPEDFEDMETVLDWVKNDELLRKDVPDKEKFEAVKYAAKCWVEIGDEELLRRLAARQYGCSVRCTTP